ncbi:MAG TPA: NIPSNAP family protein [Granulicella sp.]|jgi:hypothetical protein|nr:NIPSNAP family protein [Granulicella sp.]
MQRRKFLAASLAAATAALGRGVAAEAQTTSSREFYQLRCYRMQTGPQTQTTEKYFGEALIPALGRLGMGPVGAFKLDIGPETPTFYLLIPSTSVEALATIDLRLAKDAEFLRAAQPFWSAPATSPAFLRVESSLLAAFEGWPKLTSPATSSTKGKRIFQLRTYESPSDQDHVRKVEMFHHGEFEIFTNAGCHPVFFGDTLIGSRTPSLTYMLSFTDLSELTAHWALFGGDPEWKKLKASPRYNYEEIVSNITNLVLSPLSVSQI